MIRKSLFLTWILVTAIITLHAQVKVVFKTDKLPAIKPGQNLFLAGDFNGWNPGDANWQLVPGNKGYSVTKEISTGTINFKVTKGSWETVECSANGTGVDNRTYKITSDTTIVLNVENWQDNFAPPQKKHTASANVHIISENFDMPQLGRQRRVWIYLPADYATATKRKYPVIYMHDGQNLFDEYTSGYGEWGIDEIIDKLPAAKQCIIVGIDHGGDQRIPEYDPYDSKFGKGRGSDYVDFLVQTLKPYIDKQYRTQADARHTSIAGSSMGGLISMYAVLKYPNIFGTAGVFSPAFWIAPDIYPYAEKQKLNSYNRFYFACGDAESDSMVSDMQKMADLLKGKGVPAERIQVIVLKGEKHNEKQWNKSFPGFYGWGFNN